MSFCRCYTKNLKARRSYKEFVTAFFMAAQVETDVCVIGGGAGGLSFAAGAAQMGANVILLEKNKMGGDCLNYGCIPSKALITAARAAHTIRSAERFGVGSAEPKVNLKKVRDIIGLI